MVASQDDMQRLACLAMFDDEFRKWLFEDPAAAAKSREIYLSDRQIEGIKFAREEGEALARRAQELLRMRTIQNWG